MSEREPQQGGAEPAEVERADAGFVTPVVHRGVRFSREVLATMIALASAALGVVAALAWNSAFTAWFTALFPDNDAKRASVLFIYAVLVTGIAVVVIVVLGRVATRLRATPVEFKYPGTSTKG